MANIKLDDKLVKHIAKLSRISLSDSEIPEFKDKLNEVLKYVQVLDKVKNIKDSGFLLRNISCRLREDVVKPGLTSKEALANAPRAEKGYFRVDGALSEPE